MKNIKIYLSGGMSNLSLEEQSKWRKNFVNAVRSEETVFGSNVSVLFFDPTLKYNTKEIKHNSEREVFDYDLYNLRTSDVVVVNFNDKKSIGTAMELAIAKELKIPVIAFTKENDTLKDLHPWLLECVTRECKSMREAVDYLEEYFMIYA